MQLINTSNTYSFILTEDEWYGGSAQQQEAWINQIMREAAEFRCQYATILVQPDAIMSISPIGRRHKVWGHTFPTTREEDFKASLSELLASVTDISNARMMVILRTYAESYDK